MCTYQNENGKAPCCTHDCDVCVWNQTSENEEEKKLKNELREVEHEY